MRKAFVVPAILAALLPGAAAAKPLKVTIVFPAKPQVSTTLPAYRFAGHTDPAAELTLNGEPLRVYPTGAFVGLSQLGVGDNELNFAAILKGQEAKARLAIHRARARPEIAKGERRFGAETDFLPRGDLWARPGDHVRVSVTAGAGLNVVYRIGSKGAARPAKEVSPGIYEAEHEILPNDAYETARVTFLFEEKEGGAMLPSVSATAPGAITVLRGRAPMLARVTHDRAPLYLGPDEASRIGNAYKGMILPVTGKNGGRWRVALSQSSTVWVNASQAALEPLGRMAPRVSISSVEVQPLGPGASMVLGCAAPVPFTATAGAGKNELSVRLYGVAGGLPRIQYEGDSFLGHVRHSVPEDGVVDCLLAPRQPLWGYHVAYEKGVTRIKARPRPAAPDPSGGKRPLDGLKICLDPGHGGRVELGALGATGLLEKDANLRLTLALKQWLAAQGAAVIMTRSQDKAVALDERVAIAEAADADLFVSLHNNAIPESTDPLKARGGSVHYYHPLSRSLAASVANRLSAVMEKMGDPPCPILNGNFQVVREPAWYPSILVEFCFITHPEDEACLLSGSSIAQMAEAVALGIVDEMKRAR